MRAVSTGDELPTRANYCSLAAVTGIVGETVAAIGRPLRRREDRRLLTGRINALADALAPLGVRDVPMPATPQTVWRAIRDARRR